MSNETGTSPATQIVYLEKRVAELEEQLDALSQQPTHGDDLSVNRFAAAMKAKLGAAREKGRAGWDDPEQCSIENLVELLRGHLSKANPGNWVDIANFCMMLQERGAEPVTLAQPAPQVPDFGPLLPPSGMAKKVFEKTLENNPDADMHAVPKEWLLRERTRSSELNYALEEAALTKQPESERYGVDPHRQCLRCHVPSVIGPTFCLNGEPHKYASPRPRAQVPGDVKHAATMLNCGNTNRDFLVTVVKWVLYTDSVLRSGEGEER